MACTLAESPGDPFHRKLRQLCCLHRRFDCYRVERTSSRAGVSPAEVQRLFTAHFFANNAFFSILRRFSSDRWIEIVVSSIGLTVAPQVEPISRMDAAADFVESHEPLSGPARQQPCAGE